MKNENIPSYTELPSKSKLIKSTIIAICLAGIILISLVLPAEYGIDPTGIGGLTGLLKMGEIKVSLSAEAEAETEKNPNILVSTSLQETQKTEVALEEKVSAREINSRNDKIVVTLKPDEGKEVKLTMAEGSTVNYIWYTDSGIANFDIHGDSKKLQINYHNYEKGKLEKSEGVMKAAFDGNHGWFWRNRTSKTMNVTLEVSGSYTDVIQY